MAAFRALCRLILALMAVFLTTSDACPWKPHKPYSSTTEPSTSPVPSTTPLPDTPENTCCLGMVGRRDEPDEFSNLGQSPADNPSSTVCYYNKTSNCMVCQSSSLQEAKCCTQPLPVGDISNILANEYLIDVFITSSGLYELHPLQPDGTYNSPGENGQFVWSINTDTSNSQLGVTILNDDSCWQNMTSVIDEGSLIAGLFLFRGFLYVVN